MSACGGCVSSKIFICAFHLQPTDHHLKGVKVGSHFLMRETKMGIAAVLLLSCFSLSKFSHRSSAAFYFHGNSRVVYGIEARSRTRKSLLYRCKSLRGEYLAKNKPSLNRGEVDSHSLMRETRYSCITIKWCFV